MRTYNKVNGILFEGGKTSQQSKQKIQVFSNIINYENVSVGKNLNASTKINDMIRLLSIDTVEKLYAKIVASKTLDDLVNVMNSLIAEYLFVLKNKRTVYPYTIKSSSEIAQQTVDLLNKSLDTSLHIIITKLIKVYYKNYINFYKYNDPEKYNELCLYGDLKEDIIIKYFKEYNDITDKELKNYALYSILVEFKLTKKNNKTEHLCFDCPVGDPNKCPKIADDWPKYLSDYDFITDGVEEVYEAGECEDEESVFRIKSFKVTGCKKYDAAKAKVRKKTH